MQVFFPSHFGLRVKAFIQRDAGKIRNIAHTVRYPIILGLVHVKLAR